MGNEGGNQFFLEQLMLESESKSSTKAREAHQLSRERVVHNCKLRVCDACIQACAPLVDDASGVAVEPEHHVAGDRAEQLRVAQAILLVERTAEDEEAGEHKYSYSIVY